MWPSATAAVETLGCSVLSWMGGENKKTPKYFRYFFPEYVQTSLPDQYIFKKHLCHLLFYQYSKILYTCNFLWNTSLGWGNFVSILWFPNRCSFFIFKWFFFLSSCINHKPTFSFLIAQELWWSLDNRGCYLGTNNKSLGGATIYVITIFTFFLLKPGKEQGQKSNSTAQGNVST